MLASNFSTIQQQQEKNQGYRIFTVSHFRLCILYGRYMKCKFKQPSLSVLARVANQCVMGDHRLLYNQLIYMNSTSNIKNTFGVGHRASLECLFLCRALWADGASVADPQHCPEALWGRGEPAHSLHAAALGVRRLPARLPLQRELQSGKFTCSLLFCASLAVFSCLAAISMLRLDTEGWFGLGFFSRQTFFSWSLNAF